MRVLGPGDGHGQAGRRRAAGTLSSKLLAPAYWCGRGPRLAPKSAAEGAALSPEGLVGAGFGQVPRWHIIMIYTRTTMHASVQTITHDHNCITPLHIHHACAQSYLCMIMAASCNNTTHQIMCRRNIRSNRMLPAMSCTMTTDAVTICSNTRLVRTLATIHRKHSSRGVRIATD